MQLCVDQQVEQLIGCSASAVGVLADVDCAAKSGTSVLISGESGTGKSLVARLIHGRSIRRRLPCVTVDCQAATDQTFDAESLGHLRGTVVLDRVVELSPPLQDALCRVLEASGAGPRDDTASPGPDVQVIACARESVFARVGAGLFSDALFYRLNVVHVRLPPLRTRPEDIPLLLAHFLNRFSLERRIMPPLLSEEASALLASYAWPGNVSQLERLSARLVRKATGRVIQVSDLPPEVLASVLTGGSAVGPVSLPASPRPGIAGRPSRGGID